MEPHRRGEAVSAFFAVLFTMLSVPVIGVGVLVRATGLRTAGVAFSAAVAVLALAVAAGLVRRPTRGAPPEPTATVATVATDPAPATAEPSPAPAAPAGKA